MAAEIGVPTVRGVQSGLMDYGAGVIAGLVYNTVSTFTGSGLIGGAISAAISSSVTKGNLAPVIAVNMGFRTGSMGMAGLGLGNLGMNGARRNGNGNGNGGGVTIPTI
jgi:hypothetical protein